MEILKEAENNSSSLDFINKELEALHAHLEVFSIEYSYVDLRSMILDSTLFIYLEQQLNKLNNNDSSILRKEIENYINKNNEDDDYYYINFYSNIKDNKEINDIVEFIRTTTEDYMARKQRRKLYKTWFDISFMPEGIFNVHNWVFEIIDILLKANIFEKFRNVDKIKNQFKQINSENCKNKELFNLLKNKMLSILDEADKILKIYKNKLIEFIRLIKKILHHTNTVLRTTSRKVPRTDFGYIIDEIEQSFYEIYQLDIYTEIINKNTDSPAKQILNYSTYTINNTIIYIFTFLDYLCKNDISPTDKSIILNKIEHITFDMYDMFDDFVVPSDPFDKKYKNFQDTYLQYINIYAEVVDLNVIKKALSKLYLSNEKTLINNFFRSTTISKINNLKIFKKILNRNITQDDLIEYLKQAIYNKDTFLEYNLNIENFDFPIISKPKPAAEFVFNVVPKIKKLDQTVHSNIFESGLSDKLLPIFYNVLKSNKFDAIKTKIIVCFSNFISILYEENVPNPFFRRRDILETNPEYTQYIENIENITKQSTHSQNIELSTNIFLKLKNDIEENEQILKDLKYSSINEFKSDLDFFFQTFSHIFDDSWIGKNIHEIKQKVAKINSVIAIFKSKESLAVFKDLSKEVLTIKDAITQEDAYIPAAEAFLDNLKHPSLYLLDGFSPGNGFSFHVLQPKAFRHLTIGIETDCCQAIGGEGYNSAKDSFINPLAGVIILNYKDELVSQSYFHFVPLQGFILDNIEYSRFGYSFKNKEVEKAYAALAAFSKDKLNFPLFGLGAGHTKITKELFSRTSLESDPRFFAVNTPYSDFRHFDFINLLDPKDKSLLMQQKELIKPVEQNKIEEQKSEPLTFKPFEKLKRSIDLFSLMIKQSTLII